MNFLEITFLLFAFLAFAFGFYFFVKKKGDQVANILISGFITLFGYNIIFNVLFRANYIYNIKFIHLAHTDFIPLVLYGPILYFYLRRVIYKRRFIKIDLLHLIPIFYGLINFLPLYLLSTEKKVEVFQNRLWKEYFIFSNSHTIKVVIIVMLFYCGLIFFKFKKKSSNCNKNRWVNRVVYSFFGYVSSFSIYFILQNLDILVIEYDYLISFSMISFFGMLSYYWLKEPIFFDDLPKSKTSQLKKYKKTGLSSEISYELKKKLTILMEEDKIYLNNINLQNIATILGVSRNQASQIINEHFKMSFYDFINQYRVSESLKMFDKNSNLNITEIAYAVGFNNRISFYKAFKKFNGVNPSEYIKHGINSKQKNVNPDTEIR